MSLAQDLCVKLLNNCNTRDKEAAILQEIYDSPGYHRTWPQGFVKPTNLGVCFQFHGALYDVDPGTFGIFSNGFVLLAVGFSMAVFLPYQSFEFHTAPLINRPSGWRWPLRIQEVLFSFMRIFKLFFLFVGAQHQKSGNGYKGLFFKCQFFIT